MKTKKLQEMRNKKEDELKKLVGAKKLELLKTQAIIKAGQEKNLKKAKNLRVEIAQLSTILKEFELDSSESEEKEDK